MKNWFKKVFLCKFSSRFSIFFALVSLYILLCFIIRTSFLIWSFNDLQFNFFNIIRAYLLGFAFDITAAIAFLTPYLLYLICIPKKWFGSIIDKLISTIILSLTLFIIFFSLVAEYPFWEEFGVRFNFIAVDYLIYTYEVVENINQSMPIPLILSLMVGVIFSVFYAFKKLGLSNAVYHSNNNFIRRIAIITPILGLEILLFTLLSNKLADTSTNTVTNELGKNGTFSFFAAFRSNELDYDLFYPRLEDKKAYQILKPNLLTNNQKYNNNQWDNINRLTQATQTELRPNIILVTIESFSAEFLEYFGNVEKLSPFYDSLAHQSVFFTNLYATGTRTVRGMEALTLCVPPTPGNSIVRRPNNDNIFSIASILKQKDYQPYFIYGGDGYFDNMNTYFGGQGFDIVDRDRGNPLSDKIKTNRFNINDNEISFENAWGICDEDLYKQSLKYADISHKKGKPFFQFVMTTSNHKPYTFPEGKINAPQGTRASAIKYTDYALKSFIDQAKTKDWFKNTVFVIVADHCASSAGKWEININKHHIPAIFYNLNVTPQKIEKLTSQIDLMPTLFGYLNWTYETALYGRDINQIESGTERAYIGNYRTLGVLQNNIFTQIDDRKRIQQFDVINNDSLSILKSPNQKLIDETISFYQTASERFKNGKMKQNIGK